MGYATGLLEYSNDPLSDTTPTYIDRTSYLVGDVTWQDGKARDLDEPQAGSITFRLKNVDHAWEALHPGSLYPDSPFILRRFRWSVNSQPEGVWYVVKWEPRYPAGTPYSEIEVTCVDGFELLSLDALDLLDPPTASSYEEVVMHDAPFGAYSMGETDGAKMTPLTGPEGIYGRAPQHGQPGLVLGDPSTAMLFQTEDQYARVPLSGDELLIAGNQIALEVIHEPTEIIVGDRALMVGPLSATQEPYDLVINSSGEYEFWVRNSAGTIVADVVATTLPQVGTKRHVIGEWDGNTARILVDGVVEDEATASVTVTITNAVACYVGSPNNNSAPGIYQKAAFYEHAIGPARAAAHAQSAFARGFSEQTAGERVAAVADSSLWAETEIQAGSHTVHPVMEHGQSKLDEIRAAVKAEMPESYFFFNGDGDPAYLGWEYKAAAPYNEPQGTFGAGAGEIGYQDIQIVYDDEMFNEVTVGHQSGLGEETQHTVTDEGSIDEFYRRAHAETGLPLTEHPDAIAVAASILNKFSRPQQRVASLTLNGANTMARTQILERTIGDLIRVKGLSPSGTPVDVVTTILGRSKTLTAAGHLTCTWSTARGFNAAEGLWQLGIVGFSELGETAVLA